MGVIFLHEETTELNCCPNFTQLLCCILLTYEKFPCLACSIITLGVWRGDVIRPFTLKDIELNELNR